jgi:hypothetical protein
VAPKRLHYPPAQALHRQKSPPPSRPPARPGSSERHPEQGLPQPRQPAGTGRAGAFPLAPKKGKCSAAKAVREADPRIIRLHSRHSAAESASNTLEVHGPNAVGITASPASSATRPCRSGAQRPAPWRHPARGIAGARAPPESEWSFLNQNSSRNPITPNPVASVARRRVPRPFPHLCSRGLRPLHRLSPFPDKELPLGMSPCASSTRLSLPRTKPAAFLTDCPFIAAT